MLCKKCKQTIHNAYEEFWGGAEGKKKISGTGDALFMLWVIPTISCMSVTTKIGAFLGADKTYVL